MSTSPEASSKINTNKNITKRSEKKFKRGSLVFIEGETSTEMYILRSGKVRILKQEGDKTIELAVLGPGSVVGELSLLDHQPRTATCQVLEDSTVTVIDEQLFAHTLDQAPPWMTSIVRLVVKRLRETMKKTSDDIIRQNISGVIKVVLLLYANEGSQKEEMNCVLLSRVKGLIYAIIGLGSLETEQALLHLILKDLLMIRKNEAGGEFIALKNIDALQLYMQFLRARQRGVALMGEGMSEKAFDLVGSILVADEKHGKKIQGPLHSLGRSQLEIEMEKAGKGRFIDLDALDELVIAKTVVLQKQTLDATYGTTAHVIFVYNVETLKQMQMLGVWLPIFKEDVAF